MSTPNEVVAAWLRDSFNVMDCSFDSQRDAYYEGGTDALGVLASAGYAVVALPAPHDELFRLGAAEVNPDAGYSRVTVDVPLGFVAGKSLRELSKPDTMRRLALGILAVAAAEVGGSDV